MDSASSAGTGATGTDAGQALPPTWQESLAALVASRVALIQLESKEAARSGARRAGLYLAVVGCIFFGWLLLLAGAVQVIATATQWPWSWIALGLAGVHLILAIVFAKLAKPSEKPAFPHTCAEFQKDREWIEQLKKSKKSNG